MSGKGDMMLLEYGTDASDGSDPVEFSSIDVEAVMLVPVDAADGTTVPENIACIEGSSNIGTEEPIVGNDDS